MIQEKRKELLSQIIKYVFVGSLNTGIDFAVLNLLMWLTAIYLGGWIILLNAIAFSVAIINSYFLNKYWTFKDKGTDENKVKEFSKFVSITLVGMILNTTVVYLITTFTSPIMGISPEIWANLAKVIATAVSLVWNFLGYKFIIFKK